MAKPLEKMSADEILSICTKFFFAGFLLLPFLWVHNILYLWPIRNRPDLSPKVKQYLIIGGIGAVVMFVVSTVWFAIFVNKRLSWGAMGDNLTVVLVKGV